MTSGICQLPLWVTPKASELLSACSAMQGHSDPVLQYRRQRPKPKTASGTRYAASEPTRRGRPEDEAGDHAAGHMPCQLRSAVKT